ncbi:uncharacterized protein LOC129264383 [Lytechinus pictus]|uniref:uncharacterized protein LOC129264383 n=1 Tax=Lytechinus pictus TaxID=7653 RepID=UPI0030B9B2B0
MTMSLADTMLQTFYVPTAKRGGTWRQDGGSGDDTPYLEAKRQRMLLRSSNLAVAGFPYSLHPFSYLPADSEANRRSSRLQNGDDLKSRDTTLGMKVNDTSGSTPPPRDKPDVRSKDDRSAVDRLGKETLMAAQQASKNSAEDGDGVTVDVGQERRDCLNESRASPPCTKPLKFGIEAILSIGSKPPEKKMVNLSEYTQRILGRSVPSAANSIQYGHATPKSPGSKHAAVVNPSPRSPWNNNSPRPLGHPAGRWECFPGIAEAGRVGWVTRDHYPEHQENFQSRHSPYPWTRTLDPTIQHCYQLQPTLPPSHPTLPRSFHQAAAAASVMRSNLVQEIGQDIKANIGGSGGINTGISGNHKRKRSWSRAVFTSLQRKGLEKRFEIQKYVNKPERRQLASALGLSDAQVKVWFQNRRMKWRHTQQFNRPHGIPEGQTEDVQAKQQQLDMDSHMDKESGDSNNNENQTENCMRLRTEFGESTFADCNGSDEEIRQ